MKVFAHLTIALILPLFLSVTTHKFYVSVTDVEYVASEKSVQMISRLFIDDIENALREKYNPQLTFDPKNDSKEIDVYLERYLKNKISVKINGNPVAFKFLGKEYDNDIIFCYLEIEAVPAIKTFQLSNKVLFESFEDQQNIVKLNINDKRQSFVLIAQNSNAFSKF